MEGRVRQGRPEVTVKNSWFIGPPKVMEGSYGKDDLAIIIPEQIPFEIVQLVIIKVSVV
jgi:hypothetical protein